MSSIRWSNRICKSKVHWEFSSPTQSAIIIYINLSEDLSSEDLVMQLPEDLDLESEDLDLKPVEDLDLKPAEDLDSELKDLDLKLIKDSDTEPVEDQSYQPQFLSTNRTDRSQNLSENTELVKLFQLFFSVKEMKNIVK